MQNVFLFFFSFFFFRKTPRKACVVFLYDLTWYSAARNTNTIVGRKKRCEHMKVAFIYVSSYCYFLRLSPPPQCMSPPLPLSSFLCPSVSWSTANDSVVWRACMMFYSECWLGDVVSWVNAPSIWKILINNILFSNPFYTPTLCCALWNNDWKVYTHAQTYTYTRTHTHTHWHIYRYFPTSLCVCFFPVAPWNYTNQIKKKRAYTHTHTHTHTHTDTRGCFSWSLSI